MFRYLAAAALLSATATPAFAEIALVSATPAADTVVASPARIELRFNAPVSVTASSVDVVMTGMPGMEDHPPTKMKGFAKAAASDKTSLVLVRKTPLGAGTYKVQWHVSGAAGSHGMGEYSFKVK